jgi:hypothetical protein
MVNLAELEGIARGEFADIVLDVSRIGAKLRMLLIDGSYIDFWWSEIQEGRFGHHTISEVGLIGGAPCRCRATCRWPTMACSSWMNYPSSAAMSWRSCVSRSMRGSQVQCRGHGWAHRRGRAGRASEDRDSILKGRSRMRMIGFS